MALISCEECGHRISDQAVRCPSCGAMPRPPERGMIAKMFVKRAKCTQCGEVGKPVQVGWSFGAALLAILLLFAWIIPGIVYILWRGHVAKQTLCQRCGSKTLVPV